MDFHQKKKLTLTGLLSQAHPVTCIQRRSWPARWSRNTPCLTRQACILQHPPTSLLGFDSLESRTKTNPRSSRSPNHALTSAVHFLHSTFAQVGPVMFEDDEPISNETRFLVEQEVKRFLEEALAQANHILKTRENEHHRLAEVTAWAEFLGPLVPCSTSCKPLPLTVALPLNLLIFLSGPAGTRDADCRRNASRRPRQKASKNCARSLMHVRRGRRPRRKKEK